MTNCGYAQVQSVVVNGEYAHVQWWSMVDMFRCSGGHCWIFSCAVVVNGGYTHMQWWICSCEELVNGGYAHMK